MAGEDIWSLLTRRLYPSGSGTGTRTHGAKDDAKYGADAKEEGGEDGKADTDGIGADREGGITPAVSACTSYALCVGMPGAGKSSLLNAYLNPNNDDIPKPTVALEYMFARRASVANSPKVRCGMLLTFYCSNGRDLCVQYFQAGTGTDGETLWSPR